MTRSEEYTETLHEINGRRVRLTTYRVGDRYFSHADNVDPGATIARADGPTRDDAERVVLEKATVRMN
jgi:hypothetical protein